ncbi:MAG: transketolase [Oligoflexia bacterium]|nr:transketolase [Oligoflexia bacterium]
MEGLVSFIQRLEQKSKQIRNEVLDLCVKAGTGHLNSSFSCVEILVALYYGNYMKFNVCKHTDPSRDKFILSKGQASPALYAILGDLNFFPKKELDYFAQTNGIFGVHLQHDVPGVEITSGSLGIGFGVAAGLALAHKLNRESNLVFCLIGDGECYEGSIWEAAMFASHNRLNNLITIIDRNHLCATDFTENIIALESLRDKWKSFNWDVVEIDGHDFNEIDLALKDVRCRKTQKPKIIIANTIKGKGCSFISNEPLWHGMAPKGELAKIAKKELNQEDI